jgi:acyl-CoA thioesterase-1
MLLRSIVIFFSFVLLGGAAHGGGTVLVWGDSLSAGYQLRIEQAWPSLMQTRLDEKGFPHRVVNASVSGETTSGGRTRLAAALDEHQPELFILGLGANDGLRGLQPRLMAENLDAMIKAAREAGARVLLVGMRMPPNYGPAFTRRFEEAFRELAESNDVPLLPFLLEGFADQPEMFLPDGIHPNADAQQIILDTVWQYVLPLLESPQAATAAVD